MEAVAGKFIWIKKQKILKVKKEVEINRPVGEESEKIK